MADETENLNINIGSDPSGVEQGSKRATTSIRNVNKEAKELDTAFRRLKSSIDPTFAATERYNKTLADNQRLLAAGRISQDEYAAGARAAKAALDSQIESINRSSQSAKAAATQARQQAAQQKAEARKTAEAERQAARVTAAEKVRAAREAAAAVEAAQRREQAAIRLSAQTARQAALEARKLGQAASSPNTRGVAPGSIATDRSAAQLAYARQRAEEAAARAAQRAWDLAARAAEASSQRAAASLLAQAQLARQAAEDYSNRAIQLARTQASVEGAAAQQAANAIRAAKESERAAIRAAATEAKAAADQRRAADRLAAAAAREAADATRRQAAAEREANAAAQQLRASIDPVFASQQRYNQVMQQATQLLMQNKLAMGEWTAIQKQAKAQMDVNIRSLGQQNSMYVQLGYQAQDVTASLASGIHPLVILAQQGGQTAAALATMGGTIGKVASFIAGPWGAAIIGATLLLDFLTSKTKEQEKADQEAAEASVDLKNAEEARRVPLDRLTESLKEYTKQQKEANLTRKEAIRLEGLSAEVGMERANQAVNEALDRVAEAQEAINRLGTGPGLGSSKDELDLWATQMEAAQSRLKAANRELSAALADQQVAREAQALNTIDDVKRQVEAETDATAAIEQAFEDRVFAAEQAFLKSRQTAQDEITLKAEIKAATDAQTKAEKALAEAKKEGSRVVEKARTGNPREDAQRAALYAKSQGFKVGKVGPNGVSTGKGHAQHRAVDINAISGNDYEDPLAKARLDKLALEYQKMGYTVLWGGKRYDAGSNAITLIPKPRNAKPGDDWEHKRHLHVEAPESGAYMEGSAEAGVDAALALEERLKEIRRQALDSLIEDLSYQQQAAEDDYQAQLDLQDKKIEALKGFYGQESREVVRAHRDRLAIEKRFQQAILNEQRQGIEHQQKLAENQEAVKSQLSSLDRDQLSDNGAFNSQNGLISQKQAILEKAQLLDKEYADNLAHEQRLFQLRYKALQDQIALANLAPEQKRQLLREAEQLEAEHNGRVTLLYREYTKNINTITNEMASLNSQAWRDVASTFTSSLGSAFQGMWTRSQNFLQSMVQVADSLVYKFADMGLQMLQDWIVAQVTKKAVTTATTAQETAAVVAGQAAQTGAVVAGQAAQTGATITGASVEAGVIAATTSAKLAAEGIKTSAAISGAGISTAATAAAGIAEIGTNAAVAAAGAYKSTVVIPFIGPLAAPVAAGLALATVLGFGALISARGGQERVPYDGQITELHKDEMVLPAWAANPLREQLSGWGPRNPSGKVLSNMTPMNTSSSQREAHFYYSPTVSGGNPETLAALLRSQGQDMKKWLKNQARNNRIFIGSE